VATELLGEPAVLDEGAVVGVDDTVVGVVDGTVVGVVDGTVVAVDGTTTAMGAGSDGGTGFCHTEAGLVGPMLGKRLSLIAFATPTTPSVASSATPPPITTARQPEVHVGVGETPAPPASTLDEENTGVRSDSFVSCPCSSQWSLTETVSQVRRPARIGRWS
jgi:hypothetical protein